MSASSSVVVDLPDGELAPGTTVGEYRIEHKLGQGGMGVVYAAVHPIIGKRAAVKVISAGLTNQSEAVLRFVQEAQAVNQIAHDNIVDIFSFGSLPDGRPYFVMELLRGENLAQRLARGRLPLAESLEILVQVCRALAATHRQGIIHRDLKPENVFLEERDDRKSIKLLDFGIAKLVRTDSGKVNLTQDGTAMGTPTYASPELARARPVDGRSDVYSLGVMAFEMFVGSVPFHADNALDVLLMHVSRPAPEAASVWPDIPASLNSLLLRMMAKEPSSRPSLEEIREVFTSSSLAAFVAAGADSTTGRTTQSMGRPMGQPGGGRQTEMVSPLSPPGEAFDSTPAPARRERRWLIPAVGVLACVTLGLGFSWLTRREPVENDTAAQPPVQPVATKRVEPPHVEPAPVEPPTTPSAATTNVPPNEEHPAGTPRPSTARSRGPRPTPVKPAAAPAAARPAQPARAVRPARDDDDGAMNPYAK